MILKLKRGIFSCVWSGGSSSFLDFLLFKQEKEPVEGSTEDNLIMAIEETKTSDDESRNTGVYQRGYKFVYITPYEKVLFLADDGRIIINSKAPQCIRRCFAETGVHFDN